MHAGKLDDAKISVGQMGFRGFCVEFVLGREDHPRQACFGNQTQTNRGLALKPKPSAFWSISKPHRVRFVGHREIHWRALILSWNSNVPF